MILLYKITLANDNYIKLDKHLQKIVICDKFGWCKTNNGKYIRKFQFINTKNNEFLRKGIKSPVYFYKFDGNKSFFGYSIITRLNTFKKTKTANKKILAKDIKPITSNNIFEEDIKPIISNNISEEDIKSSNNYFISLGVGTSKYNISSMTDTKYLHNSLDDISKTFDISIGYNLNQDFFTTTNLQYSTLDNINFKYLYLTLNYNISKKISKLNTYFGVLGGYGMSKWDKSPVLSSNNNKESKKIIYGLQLGSSYKITTTNSLLFELKHIKDNLDTRINNERSIKHDYHNLFIVGVKYYFF
jgi:hypothetical protein